LFASVNEACKILEEGKTYRASDIDVMWLGGFNFPRYRAASCTGPTRSAGQPRSIARSPPRTSATVRPLDPGAAVRRLAETGRPLSDAKPGRPM
jgi:3-hydroxyacyl-CoA dehydrogenase